MKKLQNFSLIAGIAFAIAGGAAQAQVDATATLPDAKPGECYAKVIIPAKYETRTEEVVVSEASKRIEVVPAKYEMVEEKVMVKDASYNLIPVAPVYETVTEKVEVTPAGTHWTLTAKGKTRRASASLVSYAQQAGLPTGNAEAGQCYVEYYKPATYKTESETVTKKEASERIKVVPARYEWVEEQVLVKEASQKVVQVPATYETVTEKVMISPATTEWKKGRGLVERIDNSTGEIMCLVEIPAKYKTVTRQVLKTAATVETVEIPAEYATQKIRKLVESASEVREEIPAEFETVTRRVKVSDESVAWFVKGDSDAVGSPTGNEMCLRATPATYKTVSRQVLKSAATSKKVEVPAEYKTVKVRKLIEAASHREIEIPAKMDSVSTRVKLSDERLEWRQVLCETNMTTDIVRKVQTALKEAGFHPGPIDGIMGRHTLAAVDKYQSANDLERGGLTMATLDSLKVEI